MKFSVASDIARHEALFQTIATALQHDRRVVLTGAQGSGKTAVARAYARQFGHCYGSICWINMATEETLLADLLDALHLSSLSANTPQGLSPLLQTLQHDLFSQEDALIILDNFPDRSTLPDLDTLPASIVASPPQRAAGSLIMITRASDRPPTIPCVELSRLDEREGALLVLRGTGLLPEHAELNQAEEEQQQTALELARELRRLPFALALATGYLRATQSDLRAYLDAFHEYAPRTSLSKHPGDYDLETIVVACELVLTHLARRQPEILEPLRICALLLPEAIPAFLFPQKNQDLPGEDSAEPVEQDRPEHAAIQTLLAYGLLAADEWSSTLSMHPLLQNAVRQFFALDTSPQHITQALHLFYCLLPRLATESPSSCLRVARQIHHLAQLSEQYSLASIEDARTEMMEDVFNWAASLFWQLQLLPQAEFLLSKVLSLQEQRVHGTDQMLATTIGNLALLNGLLKRYPRAESLAQRAVESKVKALGINHPDVLLALDYLGRIYAEQGKQQQAKLCYERAISIGDQVQLRHHPVSCLVRYHLALLFIDMEQFNEAASLLRRACFSLERLSSSEYESLLMEAHVSLANVSSHLQNWEEAATCYHKALPLCEHLLGEEHAVTLEHLEQAALVFLQQKNVAEAEHILLRVLAVRERTPGIAQTALASCFNGLALVAFTQERLSESTALLERAQHLLADQPECSVHAAVLDTLATLEGAQQRYEQAIAVSKRALKARQRLKQKLFPRVENLNTIATFYRALGQTSQAELFLAQALASYQQEYRPEDLALDPVLTQLAEIEIERSQVSKARMYLERVRAIRGLAWGGGDPRTKEVVKRLADLAQASSAFSLDMRTHS